MTAARLYAERLKTPDQAAALIASGAKVVMGLGASQPPALLKALADRAERGEVEDVNLYYLLSTAIAGQTVLRDELMGRIRPCTSPICRPGSWFCSSAAVSSAAWHSSTSDSSIRVHTQ